MVESEVAEGLNRCEPEARITSQLSSCEGDRIKLQTSYGHSQRVVDQRSPVDLHPSSIVPRGILSLSSTTHPSVVRPPASASSLAKTAKNTSLHAACNSTQIFCRREPAKASAITFLELQLNRPDFCSQQQLILSIHPELVSLQGTYYLLQGTCYCHPLLVIPIYPIQSPSQSFVCCLLLLATAHSLPAAGTPSRPPPSRSFLNILRNTLKSSVQQSCLQPLQNRPRRSPHCQFWHSPSRLL